jgi:hypothetical protein
MIVALVVYIIVFIYKCSAEESGADACKKLGGVFVVTETEHLCLDKEAVLNP